MSRSYRADTRLTGKLPGLLLARLLPAGCVSSGRWPKSRRCPNCCPTRFGEKHWLGDAQIPTSAFSKALRERGWPAKRANRYAAYDAYGWMYRRANKVMRQIEEAHLRAQARNLIAHGRSDDIPPFRPMRGRRYW